MFALLGGGRGVGMTTSFLLGQEERNTSSRRSALSLSVELVLLLDLFLIDLAVTVVLD